MNDLKAAYVTLASDYFDPATDRLGFLTVNPYWKSLVESVEASKANPGPYAPAGVLGIELFDTARAGDLSATDVYRKFWNKFFLRFSRRLKVGDSDRRDSTGVKVVGTFECEGRRRVHPRARNLHLHAVVGIPKSYTPNDAELAFGVCWRKFVMMRRGSAWVFDWNVYDLEGVASYCAKKFYEPELASDRFYIRK